MDSYVEQSNTMEEKQNNGTGGGGVGAKSDQHSPVNLTSSSGLQQLISDIIEEEHGTPNSSVHPVSKEGQQTTREIKQAEGTEEGSAGESSSISINPNEIRYSQSSVNGSGVIIGSMKENGWRGEPIDVVKMPDGMYTTIDNTRVVAAREAGINVQANVHEYKDSLPSEYIDRFTTKKGVPKTWGEAIELRVGKQKASFRNGNRYGKLDMETIK